jgi:proteic killer suppression protein
MIKSFKHKGLEKFFLYNDTLGIIPEHIVKVQKLLTAINVATSLADLRLPGYNLHQLKGNRKEIWAITVRANWRITFKYENGNAYILDYEDYH